MSVNSENRSNGPDHAVAADCRIVVFSVPEDPEVLELALMELPNMDRASARLQSRQLPGIIAYSYEKDAAARVVEDLERLGLQASVVPAGDVPDLLHIHQAHHVRLTDDALEAEDFNGKLQSCPWSNITVISVGILPSTAPPTRHSAPTLASASSHRIWNEGIRTAQKHRPEAYVVLSDGQPGLLMASDEMNYEYLGDRLCTATSANFRLLIEDLVTRATSAWVTPSTLAFLEKSQVPKFEFRSHDDFRHYTEFQAIFGRRHTGHPE